MPRTIAAAAPADPRPQSSGRPKADGCQASLVAEAGRWSLLLPKTARTNVPLPPLHLSERVRIGQTGRNRCVPGLLHVCVREPRPCPMH